MAKKTSIITASLVLVTLQIIKPLIVIFIYKEVTNFHPSVINNYEIYQMVMEHILGGSMKPSYTIAFLFSEVMFLAIPVALYKRLDRNS